MAVSESPLGAPDTGTRSSLRCSHGCQLMLGGAGAAEPWHWSARRYCAPLFRLLLYNVKRLYWRFRGFAKGLLLFAWPSSSLLRRPSMAEAKPSHVRTTPDWAPRALDLSLNDLVRVRAREQIEATLDMAGRCRGCAFVEPMFRYCGRELRVKGRVERFFDEQQWRMLKCRNVVLLEGVHCDGSGHPDTHGCDRQCYFFWRTEWLEKIG
jgi:hypothetical protein